MSRGHSQPRAQPVRTIGRCRNKSSINDVSIIDADKGKIDVVVVDDPDVNDPDSSHQSSSCSRGAAKQKKTCTYSGVIWIDDEGYSDDAVCRNADCNASSSKTFRTAFSNSHLSEGSDSDECLMFFGKAKFSSEFQDITMYTKCGSSRNVFGLNDDSECSTSESVSSESETSDSDSSDCEIVDDSSGIREEWEKAALKKQMARRHFGFKERVDARTTLRETTKTKVGLKNTTDNTYSVQPGSEPVHSNISMSSKGKENLPNGTSAADGFREDPSFEFKWNCSVGDSDNSVGQDTPERSGSHDKDEPISENPSLERTRSQDQAMFDSEETNYCDQDIPVHHDFHGRNDGGSYSQKEDFSGKTLFTEELQEKSPNGEKLNFGKTFPLKNQPCDGTQSVHKTAGFEDKNEMVPLQTVSDSQTRKGADATHKITCFQHQGRSDFLELNVCNVEPMDEASCKMGIYHSLGEEEVFTRRSLNNVIQGDVTPGKTTGNVNSISEVQHDIIGERERHKETDDYRRAAEAEWAARQRELQMQAEESQRLRKRKKAENLRLLDMEKRQKQRVEEMRESQKRDEETINLKEQLRSEVRKELEKLEVKYRDMASLLRSLGIPVGGGPFPLSREVNAAYKQALLRFHPDRASRTDVRQQVEAEEKFKLISRLKEKLLPVA